MNRMLPITQNPEIVGHSVDLFVSLRERIEETFLQAGDGLGNAVDELQSLSSRIAEMEDAIGPANEAELARLIGLMDQHMATLTTDCDNFQSASGNLRGSVRSIIAEVRELDQVVRTIANITINSRIQGNSLVPPRPQVTAFIDRLSEMSEESEEILAEINDTMSTVTFDISAMEHEQQQMLSELRQKVIPEIASLSHMSAQMKESQAGLFDASKELANRSEEVSREVSRLIIALQIGDSVRQRIERIEDTLCEMDTSRPGEASVMIDLALDLWSSAKADSVAEGEAALNSLGVVLEQGQHAIRNAENSAFRRNPFLNETNGGGKRSMSKWVETNHTHFDVLKTHAHTVHQRLEVIRKHEERLRRIAHQIRLSGINAVIICAKLGSDGRALRELAHWLRDLTDESDAIVHRLQKILVQARDAIHELTEVQIGGIEGCLQNFSKDSTVLTKLIDETSAIVGSTVTLFSRTARTLPTNVESAIHGMSRFIQSAGNCDHGLAQLRDFRMMFPALAAIDHLDDETVETLNSLRIKYTMESERVVHDAVLSQIEGLETAQAEQAEENDEDDIFFDDTAPPASETSADLGDDLDDILF